MVAASWSNNTASIVEQPSTVRPRLVHMAPASMMLHPPQRKRVVAVNPVVDGLLDLGLRQPAPSFRGRGHLDVDLRAGLQVGDQGGAVARSCSPTAARCGPPANTSATRGSRSRSAIASISWCDATPNDTP